MHWLNKYYAACQKNNHEAYIAILRSLTAREQENPNQ